MLDFDLVAAKLLMKVWVFIKLKSQRFLFIKERRAAEDSQSEVLHIFGPSLGEA